MQFQSPAKVLPGKKENVNYKAIYFTCTPKNLVQLYESTIKNEFNPSETCETFLTLSFLKIEHCPPSWSHYLFLGKMSINGNLEHAKYEFKLLSIADSNINKIILKPV